MRPRGRVSTVLQWLLAAAFIGFAAREVARQWQEVGPALAGVRPDWLAIGLSGLTVLATYLLLVQAWRATLRVWSQPIGFGDAARIWFVSNLGKYVPGKVWQIAAMGAMAQRAGVSPAAAVGSSLLVNLVNIVAGFAVIAVTGAGRVATAIGIESGSRAHAVGLAVIAIAVGGVACLAALPWAVPGLVRAASRVTGKSFVVPTVPPRAVWLTVTATTVAWLLYGVAFAMFAHGVTPRATGNAPSYIAVYTGSYLAGYLALFAPGGVGVREAVLVLGMPRFGLTSAADAAIIAVASRLWLTVLEIVPGLLLLWSRARMRQIPADHRNSLD